MDARLSCIAAMVRPGGVVADIGTDHAYLPVHLVQTGRCARAIASDIGEGPAAAARRTVEAAGLHDRIDVRIGDGLSTLQPWEAADIVIAGMGGETIVSILQAASWVRDESADGRLLLQPMSRVETLHRYLLTAGFMIDEEHVIEDGRHLYVAMRTHFAAAAPPSDELAFYRGGLTTEEGRPFFAKEARRLLQKAEGARRTGQEETAAGYEQLAARLCEEG
ncbi:MAG: SAM-dependent methyltransferase [Clostridia bacterium]|nr:SAM-dependent methyltransferase [Clostridia bacterium]